MLQNNEDLVVDQLLEWSTRKETRKAHFTSSDKLVYQLKAVDNSLKTIENQPCEGVSISFFNDVMLFMCYGHSFCLLSIFQYSPFHWICNFDIFRSTLTGEIRKKKYDELSRSPNFLFRHCTLQFFGLFQHTAGCYLW